MQHIDAESLKRILTPQTLVDGLRRAFRAGATMPERHYYSIPTKEGDEDGAILLMPAWMEEAYIGLKLATIFPSNVPRGKHSIMGTYILLDANTGQPLATMDGGQITQLRTAAASVLAATYLARQDSKCLLMVGTGQLAPYVVRTYAALFDLEDIVVWGRTPEKAESMAASLTAQGYTVSATKNLEQAIQQADIISCATLSKEPLILGDWVKPGTHIDIMGGYTEAMREVDDALVAKANVYVDTREGALAEAGDLIQPIKRGIFSAEDIKGSLYDLCRGEVLGRQNDETITLFKSVGAAIEDLAAAVLAYEHG